MHWLHKPLAFAALPSLAVYDAEPRVMANTALSSKSNHQTPDPTRPYASTVADRAIPAYPKSGKGRPRAMATQSQELRQSHRSARETSPRAYYPRDRSRLESSPRHTSPTRSPTIVAVTSAGDPGYSTVTQAARTPTGWSSNN